MECNLWLFARQTQCIVLLFRQLLSVSMTFCFYNGLSCCVYKDIEDNHQAYIDEARIDCDERECLDCAENIQAFCFDFVCALEKGSRFDTNNSRRGFISARCYFANRRSRTALNKYGMITVPKILGIILYG
jgi:hypothetical protein